MTEISLHLGVPDNQILLHFGVPDNQISLHLEVPDNCSLKWTSLAQQKWVGGEGCADSLFR